MIINEDEKGYMSQLDEIAAEERMVIVRNFSCVCTADYVSDLFF